MITIRRTLALLIVRWILHCFSNCAMRKKKYSLYNSTLLILSDVNLRKSKKFNFIKINSIKAIQKP